MSLPSVSTNQDYSCGYERTIFFSNPTQISCGGWPFPFLRIRATFVGNYFHHCVERFLHVTRSISALVEVQLDEAQEQPMM